MKTQTKYILTGYRDPSIKLYNPKRNKKKVGLLMGFMTLLILTPMTNWLIIPTFKLLGKYPLWLYR